MLIAGDIGGTKTSLAVFSLEAGPRKPLTEATYPSARYSSLEELVRDFLSQTDLPVDRGCFAVAGPVVAGKATITNLPWEISEGQLSEALSLTSVRMVNDLVAVAYAVPFLTTDELYTLSAGEPAPSGTAAIVAPGTGLGEAYLTWEGSQHWAHPSEGGHADFAPTNSLEVEMLSYLRGRFEHVSYERVCSGRGLPNIYDYLRDSGRASEPSWLAAKMADVDDRTPIIVGASFDNGAPCEICNAAVNIFVSILGAEAANLALKVLATGGIYLGGGIPPRILPALKAGGFMQAFLRKGRMSDLLSKIPVHVILNPKAALLGAAYLGFEKREPGA